MHTIRIWGYEEDETWSAKIKSSTLLATWLINVLRNQEKNCFSLNSDFLIKHWLILEKFPFSCQGRFPMTDYISIIEILTLRINLTAPHGYILPKLGIYPKSLSVFSQFNFWNIFFVEVQLHSKISSVA